MADEFPATTVEGDTVKPQVYGSLPTDPRKRLIYISGMSQGVARNGKEIIGQPIGVVEWLIHPVELVDEHTGEVVEHQRLVLSDGANDRLSTLSPSAISAWGMVVAALGNGPYDPPVRVELREGESRKGMKFRTLIVLDESPFS